MFGNLARLSRVFDIIYTQLITLREKRDWNDIVKIYANQDNMAECCHGNDSLCLNLMKFEQINLKIIDEGKVIFKSL